MPKITIVAQNGSEKNVEIKKGYTLMELIRDAGFDDLLALCGGSCSCATCHVYIDDAWADRLAIGPDNDDENDLLSDSAHRKATSRLSCQIDASDDLDGLRVTIAPGD